MVPPSMDRNTQLNTKNMVACFDITISNHDMHGNIYQIRFEVTLLSKVSLVIVPKNVDANTKLNTMRCHVLIVQYYNMIHMDTYMKYDFRSRCNQKCPWLLCQRVWMQIQNSTRKLQWHVLILHVDFRSRCDQKCPWL